MKTTLAIVILCVLALPMFAQQEYVYCTMTNATHSLNVELTIPDFPHTQGYSWHFRKSAEDDEMITVLPVFFPSGPNSRKRGWRISLVPKPSESSGTNILYTVTWRITDFDTRLTNTNETLLNMPLGTNFATVVNGVDVNGLWKVIKPNRLPVN